MSENTNPFLSVHADTSFDQPSTLPCALAMSEKNKYVCEQNPVVRFDAWPMSQEESYKQNTWFIASSLLRKSEYSPEQMGVMYFNMAGKPNLDYLFVGLDKAEKNRIMCTLNDDVLLTQMYSDHKNYQDFLDKRDPLPKADDPAMPNLLTTKPVLFPAALKRGYSQNIQEMLMYLQQDIAVDTFEPKYLNNKNAKFIIDFAQKNNGTIFPSQFVAMRYEGVVNQETDELLGAIPGSDEHSDYEQEVLFANKYEHVTFWEMYHVMPYRIKRVCRIGDMRAAVDFLSQAEKEFIDPFYKNDPTLKFLENKLMNVPDFYPSHYSKLDNGNYFRSDMPAGLVPN